MSEQDARFRLMFERSADAILLLDTAANLFVEYNQAALDMLRCTRQELSALHPSVLSPPMQPDGQSSFTKANEMIATAIKNGSHRFEWVHRSPHRDDFPVEVLLTPLPVDHTTIIVVVWRDITERLRSEEVLRQAQRLESLAVLTGGIAHDFNNLLAAMSGHLLVARQAAHDTVVTEHLTQVEHAVARAATLTRQLLAYGGHGTAVREPVRLDALVRDILDLLRISLPPGVRVIDDLDRGVAPVMGDRAQLQQVVMNLVTNAGEAMTNGQGTLTVRVTEDRLTEAEVKRDYLGQDLQPGPVICLEVGDTGTGMSAEVLSRIFEPFFSTKSSGRGLGLSALRGIVRNHHGGVRVTSAAGSGTTFRIVLPASPARTADDEAPTGTVPSGKGTVLIVDDEATVRRSLALLVRSLGFDVLEAESGVRALEIHKERGRELAWVLMDVTMPHLDGYATLVELRRRDPSIVVVLSSGWTEEELLQRFADQPPAAFVPKPFAVADLQRVLTRLGLLS